MTIGQNMSPDESALSAVVGDGWVVGDWRFGALLRRGIGAGPKGRRTPGESPDIGHEDPMLSPTEGAMADIDLPVYKLGSGSDAFVGHAG